MAIQLRVAGSVDLAHPARADPRLDLIRADPLALEILRCEGVLDLNRTPASRGSSWRARSTPAAIPPPGAGPRCLRRLRPGTPGVVPPAAPARPRTPLSDAARLREGGPLSVDSTLPGRIARSHRVVARVSFERGPDSKRRERDSAQNGPVRVQTAQVTDLRGSASWRCEESVLRRRVENEITSNQRRSVSDSGSAQGKRLGTSSGRHPRLSQRLSKNERASSERNLVVSTVL